MISKYNRILLPIFYIFDLIIVGFSLIDAYYIRFGDSLFSDPAYVNFFIFSLISWSIISFISKTYHEHRGKSLSKQINNLIISKFVFLLLLLLYIFSIKAEYMSRAFLLIFLFSDILLIILAHVFRYFIMRRYRQQGGNFKRVLLFGDLPENGNGNGNFFPPETGYKIDEHFSSSEIDSKNQPIINIVDQKIKDSSYDVLMIANPLEFSDHLYQIVDIAENYGLRVDFIPRFFKTFDFKVDLHYVDGIPLIKRTEPLQFLHNRLVKRFIDITVAGLTFLLFYWWFYLIVGAIIKLTSRGPVLFKQKRIGIDDKVFWFYKFRTMTQPEDKEKAVNGARGVTQKNDPRVTKIGRILRCTNLDELPQIINVLKGDMSIVGPRPHMLQEDMEVRKKVPRYMIRQFVKPGITGWAAVKGYRGGTSDIELMHKRVEHDIHYIEFWTPWLDIKIISKTLFQMLTFNIPNAY